LVALVAALVATIVLTVSAATPVGAATNSDYKPCPPYSRVDLLVLMDQSMSLRDLDPNERRAEGLEEIGDMLSEEADIRLAIVGFGAEAQINRSFTSLVEQPLTPADVVEATKDDELQTDYFKGLALALDEFDRASKTSEGAERCRVLVFFTDGLYDPINGAPGPDEEVSAEGFREAVCVGNTFLGFLKDDFLELGIQTYAVLLQDGFTSASGHKEFMQNISLQVLRALTGHNAPIVADAEEADDCKKWSDGVPDKPRPGDNGDQTGKIIAVDDVDELVNDLLKLVKRSTKTFYSCPDAELLGRNDSEGTWRYRKQPAGAYIESIDLYLFGGEITEVRVGGDPLPLSQQGASLGSMVSLGPAELQDLPSGWGLEVDVLANANGSARLECDSFPVDPLPVFKGMFPGESDGRIVDYKPHKLRVEMRSAEGGPYPCQGFDLFELDPPSGLNHSLVNPVCDNGTVELDWQSSGEMSSDRQVPTLYGRLLPDWAGEAGWDLMPFTVVVDPSTTVVSTRDKPVFDCTGPSRIDALDAEQSNRLVAARAEECSVTPPPIGTVRVALDWKDRGLTAPGWHLAPSLDSRASIASPTVLQVSPGDSEEVAFDVRTDELSPDGLWLVEGTVTVTVKWDKETGGEEVPLGELVVDVGIDGLVGREPRLNCTRAGPVEEVVGEPPKERLVAAENCQVSAPKTGSVVVRRIWNDTGGYPWCLTWSGATCADSIVLPAGDPDVAFDVVTEYLPLDGLWRPSGVLRVEAEWEPGGGRPPASVESPLVVNVNVDRLASYLGSQPLQCDEQLGGASGGEVPTGPISSDGECTLVTPPWGQIELLSAARGDDSESENIVWLFDRREGNPNIDSDRQRLALDAGNDKLTIGFVTDGELKNKRWDTSGNLEVIARWILPGGESEDLGSESMAWRVDLLARSDTGQAFLLALIITLIAAALNYGGLYAILRWQTRLPDPRKLMVVEKEFTMGKSLTGRLTAQQLSNFEPAATDLKLVTSDSRTFKRLRAGSFNIKARIAPFWNILRVMDGGWAEPQRQGWLIQAKPPGQRAGSAALQFECLTLVAVDPKSLADSPKAVAAFLVPASQPVLAAGKIPGGGPGKGVTPWGLDAVKAEKSDIREMLETLSDRLTLLEDPKSSSGGGPPPPAPSSGGGPPPPAPSSGGGPPPPAPSSGGGPPPPPRK
jgi:hypothetical protein